MAAAAGDAHPFPIFNARYRVTFPILDADGDLVVGATGLDSEVSQDAATFADASNEATEIATSSGMYFLDLLATEVDTRCTAVIVKSNGKTTPLVLYPVRLPVIRTGTAVAGAASTITLDSGASREDDFYVGCYVNITNDSPAGALGQARRITDYVGSTQVATVEAAWGTNPSSASTFEILLTEEVVRNLSYGSPNDVPIYTRRNVAQSGTGARIQLDANASAVDNFYRSQVVAIVEGLGAGQSRIIENYIGSTRSADVSPGWQTIPNATSVFVIHPCGPADLSLWRTDIPNPLNLGLFVDVNVSRWLGTTPASVSTGGLIQANTVRIKNVVVKDLLLTGGEGDFRKTVASITFGAADGGSDASNLVDNALTQGATDYWKGMVLLMTSGANVGQARRITAFDPGTDTITVFPPFTSAIAAPDFYEILSLGVADGLRPITAGNEATDVAADGDVGADLQTWLNVAPNVLVGNRVDVTVGAMAANVLTAAAINAAALTAAKFGADAITSTVLAQSAADKIRDAILPLQNAPLSNIEFLFVAASDHVTPVTGATGIAGSRSIDGGAFVAVSGSIAEVANGIYQFDALAADMNGGIITFRFLATGGTPGAPDDTFITIVTGAGV